MGELEFNPAGDGVGCGAPSPTGYELFRLVWIWPGKLEACARIFIFTGHAYVVTRARSLVNLTLRASVAETAMKQVPPR